MLAALRRVLLPSDPGALRLWLALVVVIHHVTRLEIGKAPVLVFFALSGYWVQKVWEARYSACRRPWLTFIVSRWWRVAPVMILAAVLCVIAMVVTDDPDLALAAADVPRQAFSSIFVLGYALMPVHPIGPAWSLDIEMQFYLLAPLLIWGVQRTRSAVALAASYGVYVVGAGFYPKLVLSSFIVPFVLGVVAARRQWTVDARVGAAGQGLAIGAVVFACVSLWREALLGANGAWWTQFNVLLALLVLPQALVSVQRRGGSRDQLCSDQSYIVYMLHWPAILLLRAFGPSDWLGWSMTLVGLALGTAVLCVVVHRWLDRPLNGARARWVAGRRRNVPAPATKGDDSRAVFA